MSTSEFELADKINQMLELAQSKANIRNDASKKEFDSLLKDAQSKLSELSEATKGKDKTEVLKLLAIVLEELRLVQENWNNDEKASAHLAESLIQLKEAGARLKVALKKTE